MTYYTDNRFDCNHTSSYHYSAPIGPRKRIVHLWISTKALPAYQGWHVLHMYADHAYSIDCSTRDIPSAIREINDEWVRSLTERYKHTW